MGYLDIPEIDEEIVIYTAHHLSILDGCGKGFRGPLKSLSWSYPVV